MASRPIPTRRSALRTAAGTLALAAAATSALGCAVSPSDLERWEKTTEGPKRLSAVVLFDKYSNDLRVGAAMALIDMKPVKGQRVGIERLVKGALVCDPGWLEKKKEEPCARATLSPEVRAKVVEGLIPRMIEELKKAPPQPAQNGAPAADPSYKYKDAAYMLLTYDKTPIVADPAQKQALLDALRDWAMIDFNRKLNDQSQMFGMEQLLRLIGPTSVERLPTLMDRNSVRELTKMADLIDKLADTKTREEASKRLVGVIQYLAADQWRKDREPEVKAANEARQLTPTDKQFAQQMADYQEDTMTKVFAAMKKVGGQAVSEYCVKLASDRTRSAKLRTGALQALEGRLDKKDTRSIGHLIDLARNKETPKAIVDVAFRLLKQLPREAVAKPLYNLLELDDWQVRRLAGSTVLQISKVEHIPEFLDELSKRAKKNFNPMEARTYAAYIADLKDGNPLTKLEPYMTKGEPAVRVTALSYYLVAGSKNDVPKVKAYDRDRDRVPKCDDKDKNDCSWECVAVGPNKEEERKNVENIGDFVTYCVLPQIANREPKKDEKPKEKPPEAPKEPKAADADGD
ncbi:MAG: hypothetical protein FJ096_11035 [Deltaproteobacteria bacterium]|nr:hypothetical protein [Deltaproteobacteria bacterium]